MSDPAPQRRAWYGELALAALVALFALASVAELARNTVGIDYYQFWATGLAVERNEIGDVYAPSEHERVGKLYFQAARAEAREQGLAAQGTRRLAAANVRKTLDNYSTPLLYALFGAAATGRYDRDLERFQHASLLAYVLGIAALARVLRFSLSGTALALALGTMLASPFVDDLSVGNVNRLQVGLLGVSVYLLSARSWAWNDAWAGVALGLAVCFKPNLAYAVLALLAAWLATGQARRLAQLAAGGALGCVIAAAVTWGWFGSLRPWIAWAGRLDSLMTGWATDAGNVSLARVLHDHTGLSAVGWMPVAFVALACGAFFVPRLRSRSGAAAPARDLGADAGALELLAIGLGASASVLATRLGWQHYYLLCVPLLLWALRPRGGGAVTLALAALAAALVLTDLPRKFLPSAAWDPALGVALGALLLFVLGLAGALQFGRAPDAAR